MSRADQREANKVGIISKIKSNPRKAILIALIVLLSVSVAAAGTVFFYINSKLDKIEPLQAEEEENWEDYELSCVDVDGYINILVLGVDARDMDDMDEWRSDAIMIISIKEDTGETTVTSIYRDTFLLMAGQGFYDKITHAFYYGGVKESIKSINQCLDLNIRNYVIFNFNSAADVIDAMGGLDLEIEEYEIEELNRANEETWELTDREDRGDAMHIDAPGVHHVDGSMAVSYGRIRKGVGDDYKRTERMRIIVDKLLEKAKTLSPSQLNEVLDIGVSQIKTNLSSKDIIGLAYKLRNFNISHSDSFPYAIGDGYVGNVSYVFPVNLYDDVKTFHINNFGQENYEPSTLVANISQAILQYKGGADTTPSSNTSSSEGEGYGGTSSWSPTYLPAEEPYAGESQSNSGQTQPAPSEENTGNQESTEPAEQPQPEDTMQPENNQEGGEGASQEDEGAEGGASGEESSGGNSGGEPAPADSGNTDTGSDPPAETPPADGGSSDAPVDNAGGDSSGDASNEG